MIQRSATLQFVIGLLALVAVWEIIGQTGWLGPAWPPLTAALEVLASPAQRPLFSDAITATALASLWGLAVGSAAALLLAIAHIMLPLLRAGLDRFAGFVHALPLIGIAPVLIVTLGREWAPAAMACLGAYFPAYITISAALQKTHAAHRDLFSVLGSGTFSRLFRLQLPTALPGLLDALRLAAPGAVLGAVLGEWFGAPRGVGLIILSSAQNFQIPQLWAAALLATVMSLGAYGALTGLQVLARWRLA